MCCFIYILLFSGGGENIRRQATCIIICLSSFCGFHLLSQKFLGSCFLCQSVAVSVIFCICDVKITPYWSCNVIFYFKCNFIWFSYDEEQPKKVTNAFQEKRRQEFFSMGKVEWFSAFSLFMEVIQRRIPLKPGDVINSDGDVLCEWWDPLTKRQWKMVRKNENKKYSRQNNKKNLKGQSDFKKVTYFGKLLFSKIS